MLALRLVGDELNLLSDGQTDPKVKLKSPINDPVRKTRSEFPLPPVTVVLTILKLFESAV